jgi:hypothetical protein
MPDTMNYMIAGYGLIFGVLLFYSISLWIRSAKVQKELRHLAEGLKGNQADQE